MEVREVTPGQVYGLLIGFFILGLGVTVALIEKTYVGALGGCFLTWWSGYLIHGCKGKIKNIEDRPEDKPKE